ncbi:TetR/AcrR family transcriptional regulator [Gordonia sp. HY442]|uniref:TetR/AcrR family transcriptional regulator n=1 Tax=Gordonia zhenghanii TaxID=2911516 RepID=UPI001F3D55B5|nr:TetR/AcrR family transcriptional regulator [Gordonia zhenghanii]MCF8604297.1 TetR/AcrR family transcriptional regulator [Gordonia zhenghanii]
MARTGQYRGELLEVRRADRRRRLMEAGLAVFADGGYAVSSIPTVCRRAGLSSRQFYDEFANREALLTSIYEDLQRGGLAAVIGAVGELETLEVSEWMRVGVRAYFDYFREDPRRVRLCFVEVVGVSPEFEELRRQTREQWSLTLEAITRSASDRGLITHRDRTFDWTIFLGAVNTAAVEYATRPDITLDAVTASLFRLMSTGIME